jgi:hypothetical protein
MRVTPETAVPVWIENGTPETSVILVDGTILSDLSIEEARTMATQRYKPKRSQDKPLRVMHKLRISWLPSGVRIVDTPGLDDPSLAEDYEKLTLAELDRVAASIFVLLSPPGPSGEEVRVLKTLGERAVDKLFLVCNFYPDHWADPEIRAEMSRYVESIVAEGAGKAIDSSDIRVYAVSARNGFRAAMDGDDAAFEESGVAELRRDLEQYLSVGALDRMLSFVEHRIKMSSQIVTDLLVQRRSVLQSPELAKPMAEELKSDLRNSRSELVAIEKQLMETGKSITRELVAVVSVPFENAVESVKKATKRSEIEVIVHRLRLQFETASSEASTIFDQRAGAEFARLQRRLFDSFGIEDRIRAAGEKLSLDRISAEIVPTMPKEKADMATIAAGGLATGVAGGLLGGALAGGAGMALIAAGPVGWLIGLGLGALLGVGGGSVATRLATRDSLSPDSRKNIADELSRSLVKARDEVSRSMDGWVSQVTQNLDSMRELVFAEREVELKRIERILADAEGRSAEIVKVDELLKEVRALTR